MDTKIFCKTAAALAEAGEAIKIFKQAVSDKKYAVGQQRNAYRQNTAEKNARLAQASDTAAKALAKIGEVVKKIDMVFDEDGTNNDRN